MNGMALLLALGAAAVSLPGYDVKILPTSAVLQTALFRTVTAKAEALAAK